VLLAVEEQLVELVRVVAEVDNMVVEVAVAFGGVVVCRALELNDASPSFEVFGSCRFLTDVLDESLQRGAFVASFFFLRFVFIHHDNP
jgi:hypothetical protein